MMILVKSSRKSFTSFRHYLFKEKPRTVGIQILLVGESRIRMRVFAVTTYDRRKLKTTCEHCRMENQEHGSHIFIQYDHPDCQ